MDLAFRAFAAALVALLSSACQPTASIPQAPAAASPAVVRLASWNLEHLADADGTGCRPRVEADYELLRSHTRNLKADVVALQEVESARAAYRVFPADEWVVVMSDRPLSARGGFCRGSAGATIRRQDVGFAIRKGIPFRRNPDLAALGLGDPDLRWGVDVTLNLPRSVRLLSVHLKSGCNTGRDTEDRDCSVLFQQMPVLENWVDARARGGEHFAVLGDWNRRTALAGDEFLKSVSDDDPPGGRLVMTDAGRGATCIARYKDFIDHIAVGEQAADRVVPGSFVEYTYGGVEEQNFPSDHCPISIQLR
jgi:endonuclease/exonuclease/phosphatase family metal-dependent hydrolase